MFWTPKLCRICAAIGSIAYPIFSDRGDIEAKFKRCFRTNASKDDFKPKEVCNDCADKLDECCAFLDLYVASNNKFESILYETNRSELQDNWQNRIDYKLGTDLYSPTTTATAATENGVIVKPDDIVLVAQYKDDVLSIEMPESSGLGIALETFEQTQNQTVLRHSSDFYKTNPVVDCGLDGFGYNATYQKKLPEFSGCVESTAKKKPFACSDCDKSFVRKLSLKAHQSTHTNIRPYRCDVCDKSFPLRWALAGHKKIHTDLHRCKHCSKSFAVASKLERHVRTHTKDRPFVCSVEGCGKSFSDKRNLVGHGASHTKERNFACELCKKRYKTRGRLRDHQKAHTDVRFGCNICDKSFKWRTNLLAHLKKHSEFHCDRCKIDFRNRSLYLMHREECVTTRDDENHMVTGYS